MAASWLMWRDWADCSWVTGRFEWAVFVTRRGRGQRKCGWARRKWFGEGCGAVVVSFRRCGLRLRSKQLATPICDEVRW
ncbi:hypothetical protein M0R45_029743 [Rubus argutus]|uniref:Uncharacterized protein n=1 Tax=Rubus argutus TaxID=59490 RepID=A0AAW1WCJ7_RUBAR